MTKSVSTVSDGKMDQVRRKLIIGSRAKVWHGEADMTSGRLRKPQLMKNAHGRIIPIKKYEAGLRALKFLHNKGYIAVKGKFGSKPKEAPTV